MKFLPLTALLIAIVLTSIVGFAVIHNSTNTRHHVEFISGSNFEGYMNTPTMAQVNISPSLAWKDVKTSTKVLGLVALAFLWVGIILISKGYHQKWSRDKDSSGAFLGMVMFLGPLIATVILFFSAYSSRYSSNVVAVKKETFDVWILNGEIEQRGEQTYVDVNNSDRLKSLFNKPLIK